MRQRCLIHRLRNVLAEIPTGMQAEIRDGYWAIFDTTDLNIEPGPRLVEIVDKRIEAFAAKYCDLDPAAMRILRTDKAGTAYLWFLVEHHGRVRHSNFIERSFGETKRRTKVIGRFPGETSAISLVWAVLDRASAGWRGLTMTPVGTGYCKTYADHCSTHPMNCGRRPPPRITSPNPQIRSWPPRSGLGLRRRYVPQAGGQFVTAGLTAGGDEVDRCDIAGDAVDGAMQAVVQRVDVAASQTASGGDDVFGGEREVVDGAQDAAVGGLGHDHLLGIEIAKRIDGQAFGMQRGLDRRRDGRADRAQPGGGDVGHEHREQGAGVGHQQAFASVDPDQMGIPVGRAGFPDGRLRHPQQRQHLGGTSQHPES